MQIEIYAGENYCIAERNHMLVTAERIMVKLAWWYYGSVKIIERNKDCLGFIAEISNMKNHEKADFLEFYQKRISRALGHYNIAWQFYWTNKADFLASYEDDGTDILFYDDEPEYVNIDDFEDLTEI